MLPPAERSRDYHLSLRALREVFRTSCHRWMSVSTFERAWEQIIGDHFPGASAGSASLENTLRYWELNRLIRVRRPNNAPLEFSLTPKCYVQILCYESVERARERLAYRQQVATSSSAMLPPSASLYAYVSAGRPSLGTAD